MAKIKKRPGKAHLRAGEEIQSITEGISGYYRSYQKQFNTALTILVVALLAGVLYSFASGGKERKAGQMFDAAYSFYRPAGASSPDYQRALQGFQETVKQYGGTLNGAAALYFAGNALAEMGRLEEAVKTYEDFTKRYASRTFLLAMVHQRMGYAFTALGRREDALKAFSTAETLAGPGPATLEVARLYERIGNADDARKKYQELSEQLPATSLALEARSKLPPPDLTKPFGASEGKAGK